MSTWTFTAIVCGTAILAAGCGSTDAATATNQTVAPSASTPAYDFFDPCDEEMTAWFAERGYVRAELMEALRDKTGSGCSYDSASGGAAVLSRPSIPGDAVDVRVHQLLGLQGPVSTGTVAGHPAEVEIVTAGRARQDCHLLISVDYGFLEIRGGPRGKLAPSYPRDCDAVLTFADMLTREVDKRWQPED